MAKIKLEIMTNTFGIFGKSIVIWLDPRRNGFYWLKVEGLGDGLEIYKML